MFLTVAKALRIPADQLEYVMTPFAFINPNALLVPVLR
jgi:hypothetical protein